MSKLSAVIYYWVFVIVACLGAKAAGYGDSNTAILKCVIVVNILYLGLMIMYNNRQKSQASGKSKNSGEKNKKLGAKQKRNPDLMANTSKSMKMKKKKR